VCEYKSEFVSVICVGVACARDGDVFSNFTVVCDRCSAAREQWQGEF
jgi:hypothetical protein